MYTSISQIPNAGKGLYSSIDIYKDEIIAVFKGEILTDKQAKLRAEKGKDQCFIAMLDGGIMDSAKSNCFAKYANDASGLMISKFKNNSKITIDEEGKPCIVAKRKIKVGEEVF